MPRTALLTETAPWLPPMTTGEELTPDRRARQDCFVGGHHLERLREITADLGCRAEAQLVGKSGRHVGLVDHTGNVEGSGRAHHRHTDKAALGKDDVRSVFLEKFAGLPESMDHAEGVREVLEVKISSELTSRDPHIRQSEIGDQILLDSVLGSDIGNFVARFLQIRQQRQVG